MRSVRLLVLLFVAALFISGCSSSSEPASVITDSDMEGSNLSGVGDTVVDFSITVPVYQSNALVVRLQWGDKDINASWSMDELWTASVELPTNTESRLIVTFYDQNGAITLAQYQADFETGGSASQIKTITADQFNIAQWDDDNDGIANLDELIAGSYPLDGNGSATASELEPPNPIQATLELIQDKTFRFSWEISSSAVYYRLLENIDGVSGFIQIGDNIDGASRSYDHRVALYRTTNAKYIVQACNVYSCVDSNEISVPDSLVPAVGYVKATTESPNGFGREVALSADGNTFAVAGIHEVYVFSRVDGVWQQQAVLTESASVYTSGFTGVLSLSGNGDVLAVGASEEALIRPEGEEAQSSDQRAGAVYLYYRDNEQWIYQARLVSDNIAGHDKFGTAISLSSDGSLLAVGAPSVTLEGTSSTEVIGAVYLFEQSQSTWQQKHFIRGEGGSFGSSVDISYEGDALAVGAMHHEMTGSAYVFTPTDEGWQQQAFLKANDADPSDWFGTSITIDATGDTLAVGAPYFNFGDPRLSGPIGATYVFQKMDGMWQQEIRLNATWQGDAFGRDIELTGDGNTLMVSSQGASNNGIGFVAVYDRADDVWMESTRVTASNAERSDDFGDSLSLSNDGDTLVVGAPLERSSAQGINGDQTDNSGGNVGAVYLY